jgi:hypothetical protein
MNASDFQVAAVIPARDAMPDVLDAVQSALDQTHEVSEIVVVDDGSRDGTGEAVERRFADRADVVRVVRGRFGSAAAARNAGWRAAEAPWIAFLDADDLWFPDKLSLAAAALGPLSAMVLQRRCVPTPRAAHSSWLSTTRRAQPYAGHHLADLLEVNFLPHLVRAQLAAAETLGGFDATLSHAEDVDCGSDPARGTGHRVRRAPCATSIARAVHAPARVASRGDVEPFEKLARDPSRSSLRRRPPSRLARPPQFPLLRAGRSRRRGTRAPGVRLVVPGALRCSGRRLARHVAPPRRLAALRATAGEHQVAARSLRQERVALRAEPALLPLSGRGVS